MVSLYLNRTAPGSPELRLPAQTLTYIDRSNVSFGSLQFKGDLHLTSAEYGLGAGCGHGRLLPMHDGCLHGDRAAHVVSCSTNWTAVGPYRLFYIGYAVFQVSSSSKNIAHEHCSMGMLPGHAAWACR